MKDLLLVDGYNIINTGPSYRAVKDSNLEMARVRLIEDVAAYAKLTDVDAVVVFDASKRHGSAQRSSDVLGVKVVFTKEGQTADTAIERMAHGARGDRRVTVATSDYAQQKTVFSGSVLRMSAAELVARMSDEAVEAKEHERKGPRRVFLEDRIDAKVREALRRLAKG